MSKPLSSVRHFAHVHDDLPAFHAGYLVLTILVASLLNLGVFGLLIIAHMALDYVKYREHHGFSWRRTMEGMVRESLVDIALLGVGVVFAVYFHHTVALALSVLLVVATPALMGVEASTVIRILQYELIPFRF